jgi:dTDP-4-amino-4,6-dideoxygalactose transaminase
MSVAVPFLDLAAAYRELQAEIDPAAARVLASGWYIGGPEVERFEQDFAHYCGAAQCVGTGNGFDALHLSLRAFDIGAGDEVILASNSYAATVLAVSLAGATPVFVEPDPASHNLDPALIEAAITTRTRAIMPTHLYGLPADLDPILEIAARRGLVLIEDAAQAHGAAYKGRRLGAHGHAVAWSFYPTKNLGAFGDAGAVTTDDAAVAERLRRLRNYGSSKRYFSDEKGVNTRLDPLQAAILAVKLKRLDQWNARRAGVARRYLEAFADLPISLPAVPEWAMHAWHLFVITSPDRNRIAAELKAKGIETIIHYPVPPHLQAAYADLGLGRGAFPIAERLADGVLSLPVGPHMDDEQVDAVIAAVRKAAS